MTKKNWDEEADKEFETMDKDWQADWEDLRKRVMQR